jgi:hypothetical protein
VAFDADLTFACTTAAPNLRCAFQPETILAAATVEN